MKRKLISMLTFAGMFSAGVVSNVQGQECTNASLSGAYGFHAFATIVSPGNLGTPRAIIGVFAFDARRSSWTTSLTINDNGTIQHRPDTGTYIVNPDCTGTLFPASGGSVEIVVVDGGNEFYQMRSDPASIVMFGTSKKLFSGNDQGQSSEVARDQHSRAK